MNQNVYLIIGDNALGKTRYLKKVLNEALKHNKKIVTNIFGYQEKFIKKVDREKLEQLKLTFNLRLLDVIKDPNLDDDASKMYKMLYMYGDILVLDEVDMLLDIDDLMNWSSLVPFIRNYWEEIYITGYSFELDRVFYGTTKETYNNDMYYMANYNMIGKNLNLIKLSEDEADEYFSTV